MPSIILISFVLCSLIKKKKKLFCVTNMLNCALIVQESGLAVDRYAVTGPLKVLFPMKTSRVQMPKAW